VNSVTSKKDQKKKLDVERAKKYLVQKEIEVEKKQARTTELNFN